MADHLNGQLKLHPLVSGQSELPRPSSSRRVVAFTAIFPGSPNGHVRFNADEQDREGVIEGHAMIATMHRPDSGLHQYLSLCRARRGMCWRDLGSFTTPISAGWKEAHMARLLPCCMTCMSGVCR